MVNDKLILIIEDDPEIRSLLVHFLKIHNYSILESGDGLNGYEMIVKHKPAVVLLDWLLPKLDGLGILRKLRKENPEINSKIIMMSAVYKARDLEEEAHELKVTAFLTKPFQLNHLLVIIKKTIEEEDKSAQDKKITQPSDKIQSPQIDSTDDKKKEKPTSSKTELKDLPFQGDLKQYSLPIILNIIFKDAKSGILRLFKSADEKEPHKIIYFLNGYPVFAQSRLRGERLGEYLLMHNVITSEVYTQLISKMKTTNKKLGDLILEEGIISAHDLYNHMISHLKEKIITSFEWETGFFNFSKEHHFSQDKILLKMDPLRIIIDGAKRYYNESRIKSMLKIDNSSIPYIISGVNFQNSQFNFTTIEARLFDLIKGDHNVDEISNIMNIKPLEVMQFIFALNIFGIVNIKQTKEEAAVKEPTVQDKIVKVEEKIEPSSTAMPETKSVMAQLDEIVTLYLRLKEADYFTLLGVSQQATTNEIYQAFKEKLNKFHPDNIKKSGIAKEKAEELYIKIISAYKTLSDSNKRAEYLKLLNSVTQRDELKEGSISISMKIGDTENPVKNLIKKVDDGNLEEVFSTLKPLMEKTPDDPTYLCIMGWALYKLDKVKNRKKAEKHLELARRKDAKLVYPYWFMARILIDEENYEKALPLYEKAATLDPSNSELKKEIHLLETKNKSLQNKLKQILFKKM